MIQKIAHIGFLLFLVMAIFSCQNNKVVNTSDVDKTGNRKATIEEVLHTTTYSYLKLDEDGNELWIAVMKQDFKVGEVIYYLQGMKMDEFKSEELDRTFETVYFVQDISYEPITDTQQMVMGHTEPRKPHLKKIDLEIELPEGAVSIGQLYSEKNKYNGKSVTVKGQVTKVNTGIMGRNWIHIQDGTGGETNFDLTITSDDIPEVDEIVTYWGVVAVDKDFGAGYTYEIIVEEATRLNN
jgi:hypothetical protein